MAEERLLPVPEDWQRALAIVAHPDDIEYGVSSAVAKWTAAGKQVTYLLASRGEAGIDSMSPAEVGPIREAEERESARLVGVDTVDFLDYHDGVIEYGLPLRRDLTRFIRRYRPEVLLTISFDLAWPGGGLNQADHRTVGLAVCDAVRDAGNRWIFPELREEGLDHWSGVRLILVSGNDPTHACDVGDALEQGIASLRAHHVYFDNLGQEFDPDAFLRGGASETGRRFGCRYAIGFRSLRL